MVYDCFSFFNELDLLEIRLHTLDKVVDKFILAESPLTHTGNPKPLYYAENKARFAKFNDRIIHVVVEDFPERPTGATDREMAWIRENWQRNALVRGLPPNVRDDDVLIVSDLDEIPHPDAVRNAATVAREMGGVSALSMKLYSFYLNMRNVSRPFWDTGPKVITVQAFGNPDTFVKTTFGECCPKLVNSEPTASRLRLLPPTRTMGPPGWHFSWQGGEAAILMKIQSVSESYLFLPLTKEHIQSSIRRGRGFFYGFERFLPELLDDTFPPYVLENRQRFAYGILPCTRNPSRFLVALFRIRTLFHDAFHALVLALTPRFLIPLRARIYAHLYDRRISRP